MSGEVHATWATVEVLRTDGGLADGGGVDDGGHLLDVAVEEKLEEGFITVLQTGEVQVLAESVNALLAGLVVLVLGIRCSGCKEAVVHALQLVLNAQHSRRQQPAQPKPIPLTLGKGNALYDIKNFESSKWE